MRPRFGGAPDAYNSYQPESYAQAEFPSNRKYFFFSPNLEQRGMCSIANLIQTRSIPSIHMGVKRRPAPQQAPQAATGGAPQAPQHQYTLKQWGTLTKDTDSVVAAMNSTNRSVTTAKLVECRARVNSDEDSRGRLALMTGQTQQSHVTDFVKTCIYGPGGSACSAVGPELFRDSYLFLSRRGYAQPIAIGGAGSHEEKEEGGASSGGTVRSTFVSMLNPLLDPTMSCPAINNMLPSELRIFRAPDSSKEVFEDNNNEDGGAGGEDGGAAGGGEVVGLANHKATSSSSFLFSKSSKVFRIKALRSERVDKPVRRGATVTIGGRIVPSQGGALVGSAVVEKVAAGRAKGASRGKAAGGAGADEDDEDVLLAVRFGGVAGSNAVINTEVDEFALVDPAVGTKRGRDGAENGPVDDGGDGVESNGDADTNSLSSFSGDDDDNEDMSDGGGGSGDELYL